MKKLKEELGDFAQQMSANAPAEALEVIGAEIKALVESGIVENTLKAGDTAPDFELQDSDGNLVSLNSLTSSGSVVISFNRGNWCPFCNIEFAHLQNSIPAIQDAGANLIVVSPQLPEKSAELKQEHGYNFPILYDRGNEVARKFGNVFTLPEPLRPIHQAFGMDIPGHNGDNSYELPLPGIFVVNSNKKITFVYANANWMERAEPEEYLSSLGVGQFG